VTSPGNPFTNQRDFLRGLALAKVSQHAVVKVSGPDRLPWLNSLISQEVLSLDSSQTTEGLILDPKGHVEHAFLLTDDSPSTWLITQVDRGDALVTWLLSMKFRMDVEVSNETDNYLLVALSGEDDSSIATTLRALGAPVVIWRDPWPQVGPGSVGYALEPHPGASWSLRYELYDATQDQHIRLLPRVDEGVIDALAIGAGRPSLIDTDEKSLPHESDWLRTAVHLDKGCYRGQETVAKVHNLGHPPRRLTLLHLDGSQSVMPVKGDVITLLDREVGVITRAAWHYELGPVAVGLIKRMVDVDATLTVASKEGPLSAHQEVLVPPDAGATRAIPRLPRHGRSS
jgi:folate-binding protein YgfZ